jgi:hypothetical protein
MYSFIKWKMSVLFVDVSIPKSPEKGGEERRTSLPSSPLVFEWHAHWLNIVGCCSFNAADVWIIVLIV